MKIIFLCLVLVGVAVAYTVPELEDLETEWTKFKRTNLRTYRSTLEEKTRKLVFAETYETVKRHNELYAKGEKTHFLVINKFADNTRDEIKSRNGYKKKEGLVKHQRSSDEVLQYFYEPTQGEQLPDELDWRAAGAVTGIKDQSNCGSCWAFSTVAALEGAYFLKTGNLVSLSEQDVLDCCAWTDGNCDGGWQTAGFTCIFVEDGINPEDVYPYESGATEALGSCRFDASRNVTSDRGFGQIINNDENYLKSALATIGPLAISIQADIPEFVSYGGGVMSSSECTSTIDGVDHAVLLVGYGSENGQEYWIVKNSWGLNWGDQGYIKIAKGANNMCGMASDVSFPIMY